MCGSVAVIAVSVASIRPPSRSVQAGTSPRYWITVPLMPDSTPALGRVDTLIEGRGDGVPDAGEYRRVVDAMLARNPPAVAVAGWPPAQDELRRALADVYIGLRDVPEASDLGGGWVTAITVCTSFGDDFLTRARVARNWIGTLGVEEAMYIMAEVDAAGEALTGARRYRLCFPAGGGPQVDAFWSITLYRRSDCLLVANRSAATRSATAPRACCAMPMAA